MIVCPNCKNQLPDNATYCNHCGVQFYQQYAQQQQTAGMNFNFDTNTATPGPKTFYEYKVLSQKDKWFSGKFDPLVLEQALNAYAQQGWRVVGCATADIPGFGVARQEFVTILERER